MFPYFDLYVNIYGNNVLDYYYMSFNYSSLSHFNFFYSNFIFLDLLKINFYFLSMFVFDIKSEFFLSNFENIQSYNSLWLYGYLFDSFKFFELDSYLLNTSGKLRFSNCYLRDDLSFRFFNKDSNIWLSYSFYFFENYKPFTYRTGHKAELRSVRYASDLYDSFYIKNLVNYYGSNSLGGANDYFSYMNLRIFSVKNMVMYQMVNDLLYLIENFKLNFFFKEVPAKIGLNYLFQNGYLSSLESKQDYGIKFLLYNDFVFDTFYVPFKFDRFFGWFGLYNMYFNGNVKTGESFVYQAYFSNKWKTELAFTNFMHSKSYMTDSLYNIFYDKRSVDNSNFVYFFSETLNFSKVQNQLVYNININYFNSFKGYACKFNI